MTNKTKIIMKDKHLATVTTELLELAKREFYIINYIAWVSLKACEKLNYNLEVADDIPGLNERLKMQGFSSVGEWLDCIMREELGLWPPKKTITMLNRKAREDSFRCETDEGRLIATIAPWSLERLYPFAEYNLKELLRGSNDFEFFGKLENGKNIIVGIRRVNGLLNVSSFYEGRLGWGGSEHTISSCSTYDNILAELRESRDDLLGIHHLQKYYIHDESGFVSDDVTDEELTAYRISKRNEIVFADDSPKAPRPDVEANLRRLMASNEDFEIRGQIKNDKTVSVYLKTTEKFIEISITNTPEKHTETDTIQRTATYEELAEAIAETYSTMLYVLNSVYAEEILNFIIVGWLGENQFLRELYPKVHSGIRYLLSSKEDFGFQCDTELENLRMTVDAEGDKITMVFSTPREDANIGEVVIPRAVTYEEFIDAICAAYYSLP